MSRIGLIALVMALSLGAAVSAAPVEIEFWFVANQSEADAWFELAELFNESQDEIHVNANWDATWWGAYQEKMLVMMAAGEAPDILRLSDEAFPDWAYNGYLQPLDDLLARDIDASQYLPPTIPLGTYDGHFYGFPQGLAARALAYNRTMFANAGVDYPTDDWRWDVELLDAARKLSPRNDQGEPTTYGIGFHYGGADALRKDTPELLWSFGGELFDAEGNFRLADPDSVRAVTFIQELVVDHRVFPADFDVVGPFLNGTLAMWNTGVWDVGLLRQYPSLDWDFAPTPGGPAGQYSFVQGNGIYVIPTGVQTDAAWEFMKFMASEDGQRVFGLEYGSGGVPLHTGLVSQYVNQPAPPDSWAAFVTSVNRGRMVHHPRGAGQIFSALNTNWEDMRTGTMSVQAWLDAVRPQIDSIMEASK